MVINFPIILVIKNQIKCVIEIAQKYLILFLNIIVLIEKVKYLKHQFILIIILKYDF